MELESRIMAGHRVKLRGTGQAAVAKEWRDVAKQFRSAFKQKKLCVYCYTKLLQGFC
jgi:hypothetical protein